MLEAAFPILGNNNMLKEIGSHLLNSIQIRCNFIGMQNLVAWYIGGNHLTVISAFCLTFSDLKNPCY